MKTRCRNPGQDSDPPEIQNSGLFPNPENWFPPGGNPVKRIQKVRPPPCFFVIRDFPLVFTWVFPWGKPVFRVGEKSGILDFRRVGILTRIPTPGFHQANHLVSPWGKPGEMQCLDPNSVSTILPETMFDPFA